MVLALLLAPSSLAGLEIALGTDQHGNNEIQVRGVHPHRRVVVGGLLLATRGVTGSDLYTLADEATADENGRAAIPWIDPAGQYVSGAWPLTSLFAIDATSGRTASLPKPSPVFDFGVRCCLPLGMDAGGERIGFRARGAIVVWWRTGRWWHTWARDGGALDQDGIGNRFLILAPTAFNGSTAPPATFHPGDAIVAVDSESMIMFTLNPIGSSLPGALAVPATSEIALVAFAFLTALFGVWSIGRSRL